MNPNQIKKILDETVVDYCEGRIGVGEVSAQLSPYATGEVYDLLNKAGMGRISSRIDQIADIDYFLSQDSFNHHAPGNVLKVIDKYYEEIKK